MALTVVAFTTDGFYEEHASQLKTSLDILGIPYVIEQFSDQGKWRMNSHLRPAFLHRQLEMNQGPLLSLDADCVVLYDPTEFFLSLSCDVAVGYRRHKKGRRKDRPGGRREMLPGTMLLHPTQTTFRFLNEWAGRNLIRPRRNDRYNCAYAAEHTDGLRISELPPAYTFIFDTYRRDFPDVVPIIEHHQVSREAKKLRSQQGDKNGT